MADEEPEVPPPTQDVQADEATTEPAEAGSTSEPAEAEATKKPSEVETTKKPSETEATKKSSEVEATKKPSEAETAKKPSETHATKETAETPIVKDTAETPEIKETVEPPIIRDTVIPLKDEDDRAPRAEETSVPKPDEAHPQSQVADGAASHPKKVPSEKVTETLEFRARRKSPDFSKSDSSHHRHGSLKRASESLNSRAKLVLGSIISIRKSDVVSDYYGSERGKFVRYMNTYKLDSDKPFNQEKVQKILEEILLEALEGPYDEAKCPIKAKQASLAIRARVKEFEFDRYKLVCIVTIGEKHNQDVMVACRFLWDAERDRFALFSHETSHVFGIALCFGLYYE
ncbi:hypothetical protein WA026_018333 [Henosepilachna vigintioctopunctata]|uniref:Uncharacterized protein n=1 Tax=Henosepilachna vigintioctopunctata TaxID=420089 RepID=A0AAW1VBS5_9CUCU